MYVHRPATTPDEGRVPRSVDRALRIELGDVQPAGEVRAADLADEGWISADDELFTCPRQPDVEAFPGALELAFLVDEDDHGSPLEALESQHVTVEDLIGIPEGVPVGLVPVLLTFCLFLRWTPFHYRCLNFDGIGA